MNNAIAMMWAYYGHIAELLYQWIERQFPGYPALVLLAPMWPMILTVVIVLIANEVSHRLMLRRLRRDIAARRARAIQEREAASRVPADRH